MNLYKQCCTIFPKSRSHLKILGARRVTRRNVPFNFFTVARTCYCSEQKIFTRPDDCAELQKFFFFCNMRNKNIYNENWKIPAPRQQFRVGGSSSVTARPRAPAASRGYYTWSKFHAQDTPILGATVRFSRRGNQAPGIFGPLQIGEVKA
jgi:hypothetical protein